MARTWLAAGLVLAAGLWMLHETTLGLRAFTEETARRISVRENPPPVPDTRLQIKDGRELWLSTLEGRYIVATFMYTSCHSVCPVVAARMAQIRTRLQAALDADRVHLLSISFDPEVDSPARLSDFAQNFSAASDNWWMARSRDDLKPLLDFFGVTVIPVGNGMYVHNAAYYLIDDRLRLIDIVDENRPDAVIETLEELL